MRLFFATGNELIRLATVTLGLVALGIGMSRGLSMPASVTHIVQAFVIFSIVWVLVTTLEYTVWRRCFGYGDMPRQRKLVTDLFGVFGYIVAALVTAFGIFDMAPNSMFATSGVLLVLTGFALQTTLGDLFAGLALNIERPFKAGDWITLENGTSGVVMVTNWRATRIRTRTADIMFVPNSQLARNRLTNHIVPTLDHLMNVKVPVEYGVAPAKVEAALRQAFEGFAPLVPDKPLNIFPHEMNSQYVVWVVYFFINDFARAVITKGEASRRVQESLLAAGLAEWLPKGLNLDSSVDRLLLSGKPHEH